MTQPPRPLETAGSALRVASTSLIVRGLEVEAEIGVYAHEQGRRQPLIVDVEHKIAAAGWRHLADTVNYETIVYAARRVAAAGHIGLVESFAHRLAQACLAEPRVPRARVRVEKPLARAARRGGGVEIVVVRA